MEVVSFLLATYQNWLDFDAVQSTLELMADVKPEILAHTGRVQETLSDHH